jgi:outer membrane immunogenic protein
MFKTTLALALLSASVASAADLASSYSPPASNDSFVNTSNNWTGAYVGAHAGTASRHLDPFDGGKGFDGGLQGGYNADVGGVVVGGEADLSYLGDADVRVNGGNIKERHRLGLKAKAGVPMGQTLIYGTTGLAMTNYRDANGVTGPDGWKPGYIVGVGVEQKLNEKLSAKMEYNYTGTSDVHSFANGVSSERDVHDHTITAGLNYKF